MEDEGAQEGNIVYINHDPVAPLDPTKLYIHRHPYSGHGRRAAPVSSPPKDSCTTPKPPYWPYDTMEDFQFAEICLEAGLVSKVIDRLVKLTHQIQANPGSFTVENAKKMMETADKATLFKEETASINEKMAACLQFQERGIKTKFKGSTYTHTLYSRDIDTVIREVLADPELTSHLTFDAERRYVARPDGTPMRVYGELHHGDHMWQIQVSTRHIPSATY